MGLFKILLLGVLGGALYMGLELAYRGRTYASMGVAGGLCFVLVGALNELAPGLPLAAQGMLGGGIITAAELAFGLLLNRRHTVWDYTALPHNFRGQICLPFFAAWVLLSFGIVFADDLLRLVLLSEAMPAYSVF